MSTTRNALVRLRADRIRGARSGVVLLCLLCLGLALLPEAQAKTATAWWKEAETHYKNKKYAECIKAASEALKLEPNNTEALRFRGLARCELKDYTGTISDWDQYIALRGVQAAAFSFYNRGLAKRSVNDYRQAFKDFDRAAQLQKDYDFAIWNRGRCRHALGDYEGAFEDYSQALKLKPGQKDIIADINRLEKDIQAGKGMATSPALRELMNARISVFELYLDDLRTAGLAGFGLKGDRFRPLLESVDYDAGNDRVIMFFTLAPDDDTGRVFGSGNLEWKGKILAREADALAVIAGCAASKEIGEAFGLIHIVPFRGVSELARGAVDRVKNEIAAKTVIALQMEWGGKVYYAVREPGGRTTMREAQ